MNYDLIRMQSNVKAMWSVFYLTTQARSLACLKYVADSAILRNAEGLTDSQVTINGHWSEKIENSYETANLSAAVDEITANPERDKHHVHNEEKMYYTLSPMRYTVN